MANKSANLPSTAGDGGRAAHPLMNLRQDIDRMFDDFLSGWPTAGRWPQLVTFGAQSTLRPEVDFSETDDGYEISAELPGINDKDIDITLSGDILTLSAEKKESREEKDKDYYLSERSYGRFRRSFTLPADAVTDKIDTSYRQGVLTISVPKSPETKTRTRKIQVRSD